MCVSRTRILGEGTTILDKFSLSVPAGSTCALVGPSGCGKTTALSLLLRDYDAQHGRLLLDGRDIREVERDVTRGMLSVAPQQPMLIGDSIREAISFGVVPVVNGTVAGVEDAAKQAGAHDFICEKPEQYGAAIGRGGSALSGGERQRLCLARALARPAPVLVLDEPTSALDAATAAAVSDAILESRPHRPTTLLVTHNLALLRRCDAVAVVSNDGRVVQHGRFADLVLDSAGALAQMMKAGGLEDDAH